MAIRRIKEWNEVMLSSDVWKFSPGLIMDYEDFAPESIANLFGISELMKNKEANRDKAFEAGQEFDQRIDAYVLANPDATYAEQQEYARDLRMNIIDKYKDIEIEKVTAFNLTSNKFNVTREADAVFELKKQYDADPSQPNTLKTLAKLNGFVDEKGNPDVGALLNVYIPILQDREKN